MNLSRALTFSHHLGASLGSSETGWSWRSRRSAAHSVLRNTPRNWPARSPLLSRRLCHWEFRTDKHANDV